MISNQVLQNTIEGIKTISRMELCVVDIDGKVIATSSDEMDRYSTVAVEFAQSPADSQEVQGCQFFKIYDEQQLEYILVTGGSGEDIYTMGKLAAFQIQNLLVAYKERFDKDNFIKNLLLDNLLLVDIFSRAKKFLYASHSLSISLWLSISEISFTTMTLFSSTAVIKSLLFAPKLARIISNTLLSFPLPPSMIIATLLSSD